MDTDDLAQIEKLWANDAITPVGLPAQRHVFGLIAEVRVRDESIKFLLWSLMRPGVGLFENAAYPGTWYLLYSGERGDIVREDVPAELIAVLNSPEGRSWTRS